MSVAAGPPILVVGAGAGGLAAAIRLSCAGLRVIVLERHAAPGGKLRALPSPAGPVDAGPTVLTLRPVLDALFAAAGARLEDSLALAAEPVLARHLWPGGGALDLHADPEASARAVRAAMGPRAEAQHRAHMAACARLYAAFEGPMMQAASPDPARLAWRVATRPRLLRDMAPGLTLAQALARRFDDPRLRQLYGRYATYVGASPYEAPALLGLIAQAEALGVWRVQGGMARLARALADLARARGAEIRVHAPVREVIVEGGAARGVLLEDGARLEGAMVLHAGDPRALAAGLLGKAARGAVRPPGRPSLSARVWSFAAAAAGLPLAHHTVLFSGDDRAQFAALAAGRAPADPTLYLCAQDRQGRTGRPPRAGLERFEIILNAPPLGDGPSHPPSASEEDARCHQIMLRTLRRRGLRLDPEPGIEAMTGPAGFAALFPGSLGALYGARPSGIAPGLERPRARSRLPGLYLAGGGAHPGAGVPMALLSGRHAAEAIMRDLASTSRSRPRAMPGGISMRWRAAEGGGGSTSSPS